MKKLITILLLFCTVKLFAQTTYYISTSGNDGTGTGSAGNPWKTLSYACTQVSTAGDTIYVNAGTYTEVNESVVSPGVSIKGAGLSSHLIIHYSASWNSNYPIHSGITFLSASEGSAGNQTISNLLIDGDALTANTAILIKNRSNVTIRDLTIKDFYINAVCLIGSSSSVYDKPTTYSQGNQLINLIIDNCTDTASTYVGGGLINTSGQKDLLIQYCTLSDTSRGAGANGDIVSNGAWDIGTKYLNNTSYKPSTGNDGWNFHVEIPRSSGGIEIAYNNFYGGDQPVDVGNSGTDYNYSYPYWFSVHDNYFYDPNPGSSSEGKTGISIEGIDVKNVLVYKNVFNQILHPIGITDGAPGACKDSNIHIYQNVAYNSGIKDAGYANLIQIFKSNSGGSIKGLFVVNNTIIPNATTHSSAIDIQNSSGCTMSNIVIANNIITDSRNAYWLRVSNSGTFDSLIIRNNILYNNQNSNTAYFTGNSVTNYINSGTITSDPLFMSSVNFALQPTSPAIGAAYNYGYGADIGGIQSVNITNFIIKKGDIRWR